MGEWNLRKGSYEGNRESKKLEFSETNIRAQESEIDNKSNPGRKWGEGLGHESRKSEMEMASPTTA
jgi:hypothetical protein